MALRLGRIGDDELVLEIGSGDRPNPRSDVLVDRYPEDNTERGGDLRVDRPLVVADAHHLPFKDRSFDYVVCYHILEHMDDPARFIREITRVGRRGHIQSPSEVAEKLFHWPFHRWYVNLIDGRLILVESGRYDVKLTDKTGRKCVVRDVEVKGGRPYAFSIEESDLKDCGR